VDQATLVLTDLAGCRGDHRAGAVSDCVNTERLVTITEEPTA
jgi:hypothetical protein